MRMDLNERIIRQILKLGPVEFLGVCEVLHVRPVDEDGHERPFEDIWDELCDNIDKLNRIQKRNLNLLVRAAVKGIERDKRK